MEKQKKPLGSSYGQRHRAIDMLNSTYRMFETLGLNHTSHDFAAQAIHNLYNASPRARTLRLNGEVIRLREPPHGFTTYPIDWNTASLPPTLIEFFAEGEEGLQDDQRLNIFTHVFRTERTEPTGPISTQPPKTKVGRLIADLEDRAGGWMLDIEEKLERPLGYYLFSDFRANYKEKEAEKKARLAELEVAFKEGRARQVIGEDIHYIFSMSLGDKQFEIRVKRGGYYYGGCEDLFRWPNRSLEALFLTAVDNKFRLDDPGNFRAENEPLLEKQDELLAATLAFAVDERQRQLTLSDENSKIQTLASSAANRRRQLAT